MLQILILACLAIYLIIMFAIGIYGKKYASNFSDYLTAGKRSTVLMVIGTAVGAHIGNIDYSVEHYCRGSYRYCDPYLDKRRMGDCNEHASRKPVQSVLL